MTDLQNCELLNKNAETRDVWCALFAELDRFFYSPSCSLPQQWLQQAYIATNRLHPQRRSLRDALRLQHLFPKAETSPSKTTAVMAAIVLSGISIVCFAREYKAPTVKQENRQERDSAESPAKDPLQEYLQGNWSVAERLWKERIQSQPRDWHSHNNIALALLQQQRWQEAALHLIVARLLAPRSSDVVWNGQIVARQLPQHSVELLRWLTSQIQPFPAALGSAVTWQLIAIISSWLAAAGAFFLLCRLHFHRYRHLFGAVATVLFVFSFFSGASSAWAIQQWGILMDPSLVIIIEDCPLRSIPTVVDEQIYRECRAGEAAVVKSRFLTWIKLGFPSGEEGWIPARSVTAVYYPLPQ